MIYSHQPKDIDEQVSLLQCRGLIIADVTTAKKMLENISYFRLASYLRCYETDAATHRYAPDTRFEQVVKLYVFDRKLRLLIFSAIQDIEIALRTKMVQIFSTLHGPFWFMDSGKFNNANIYQHCLQNLIRELNRSNEDFINEHLQKYSSPPYPPAWKTLEVASFGTLSNLYCNFSDTRAKKLVANSLGLPNYRFLESWIQCATVLRNTCAHHARVWNRRFAVKPKMPATLPNEWITPYTIQPIKLYPQLCYLAYLDNAIVPNSSFAEKLVNIVKGQKRLNLHAMGFPANWEQEPLWRTKRGCFQRFIDLFCQR